jgi:hypothetical protein
LSAPAWLLSFLSASDLFIVLLYHSLPNAAAGNTPCYAALAGGSASTE